MYMDPEDDIDGLLDSLPNLTGELEWEKPLLAIIKLSSSNLINFPKVSLISRELNES